MCSSTIPSWRKGGSLKRRSRAERDSGESPAVTLISLGCSKNLVDSELMLACLAESGLRVKSSLDEADVVVINTCSFLQAARKEAADCISDVVRLKERGKLRGIVVAGCLPAFRGKSFFEDFPAVDAIVGPRDRRKVAEACSGALNGSARRQSFLQSTDSLVRAAYPRAVSTGRHSSYLKISEGCDNRCSYCLIPSIRGQMVSRAVTSIVREATVLAENGVRELCLIAQDTTRYGEDRHGRSELGKLVQHLSRIEGLEWIRLLYTHPAHWSNELIDTFARYPQLCRYADIPIQHVSDKILGLMKRQISQKELAALIARIRDDIPGMSLRTTVMVGFPGEGEDEFSELLEFVKHFQFDHLGTFVYSREDGTPAARYSEQLPEEVKQDRLRRIMDAQRETCSARNRARIGERVTVLLDSCEEDGTLGVGRTEGQAPEVDSVVQVKGENLSAGGFFEVSITGATGYDLSGEARFQDECIDD
jgi:ribosomal protein S12 methylthiotransferase